MRGRIIRRPQTFRTEEQEKEMKKSVKRDMNSCIQSEQQKKKGWRKKSNTEKRERKDSGDEEEK